MALKSKSQDTPILLVGATGTGKSAVAMELARAWTREPGAAILCMDAMQVYRGADIGTSKPSAADRAEVPHGGLDLVDFGGAFDVAQYLKYAEMFLQEQRKAERRVIIVGGTGLYFRALTRGLCEAPQGSDELRAELAMLSVEQLQKRLKEIDPAMLERIDVANPRRLVRAVEVFESTGKSLHAWQEETPEPLVKDFAAYWIQREKTELEKRIEARVDAMFAGGWIEEVRTLVERFGTEAVRRFAGIGYGEIAEGLRNLDPISKRTKSSDLEEGKAKQQGARQLELILRQAQDDSMGKEGTVGWPATATLEKLKSNILVATRQYSKRQLTWFAREPNLKQVMLAGTESFSAALHTAGALDGRKPDSL